MGEGWIRGRSQVGGIAFVRKNLSGQQEIIGTGGKENQKRK